MPARAEVGQAFPLVPRDAALEVKFRAELSDTRILRRSHHTHRIAENAEIAVWVIELGVIEDVKEFYAHFKGCRFRNSRPLHQTDIEIVDSGTVEELPIGVAERAHWSCVECIPVEKGVIGIAGIHNVNLAYKIRHICVPTTKQRDIISVLADRDRQPGGDRAWIRAGAAAVDPRRL